MRIWALVALKISVSVLLLWWLASALDFSAVVKSLQSMAIGPVIFAYAALLFYGVVSAERWRRICRKLRVVLPFGSALRLFFISMFFNQTLSTTIGGDAARVWLLREQGFPTFMAVAGVVHERIAGLLGLGVLAFLATILVTGSHVWGAPIMVAVGVMAAVILGAEAWSPARPRWLRRVVRACRLARRMLLSMEGLRLLVLSIVIHGIGGVAVHQLLRAMGLSLDLWVCLLVVPPTLLLATLPISIGGWGVREAALVAVLVPLGAPAADAFMVSVVFGVMVMAAGLPGGVLLLFRHGAHEGSIPTGRTRSPRRVGATPQPVKGPQATES
jgi:glycosyltransferase 2 family protein